MRLYSDLAAWWPLLDDPADYAEEAGVYGDRLTEACDGPIESLLELGSGGGNTASHLKRRFRRLVLTDLSEDMLAVSRALNPECEHRVGDMRTLRLGCTFDAVFVHDAVCYMTTEADLRRAIETAWVHCRPGGAVLFAPDYVRENFRTGETTGGCDEPPFSGVAGEFPRGLRYLEWVWDPDPGDTEYLVDYAFLLRRRDGSVRAVQDRHVEGLFARDCWLDLLAGVGFEARSVPLVLSDVEWGRHEMLLARRPR
jgi:SAM-dependent methyltransferase